MRHRVNSKRLKRTSGELKSLLVNQSKSLFRYGFLVTTLAKAKVLRPFSEKIISIAREKNFNNIKRVKSILKDDEITRILFDKIAPKYTNRPGGYTRIIKTGRRKGDNAPMARIELVEEK